jgi:hypothetical protein
MDLCRIEECECKGSSRRFFSQHNYIFDIPLEKIFELSSNINLIEMSKSFKLKTGKFSQVGSTELANISDLKGKLFLYFKMLLSNLKSDCPAKGVRCELNNTTKKLYLNNLPNYLTFCLQRKNTKNLDTDTQNIISTSSITVTDTLKTLILIPKLFDLSSLFEHSSKQKVFFEFFGGICVKPGQTYTCFFKSKEINSSSLESFIWSHYDDENFTSFSSWFDLISHLLKNLEFPLILFYQIQEKYTDSEKDLTQEELQTLERYARSADNTANILQNRFRPKEDVINFDYDFNFVNENIYNENLRHLMKRQKQSSKNSTSISTSKPNSNNNSNSRIEQPTEYICSKCLAKNRIENQICSMCNRNNEDVIEDLLRKRGMNNYINIANFNLNINTGNDKEQKVLKLNKSEKEADLKATSLRKRNYSNSNLIAKTNKVTNPFVDGKNLVRTEDFISDDSEDDYDYANKKSKRLFYVIRLQYA